MPEYIDIVVATRSVEYSYDNCGYMERPIQHDPVKVLSGEMSNEGNSKEDTITALRLLADGLESGKYKLNGDGNWIEYPKKKRK